MKRTLSLFSLASMIALVVTLVGIAPTPAYAAYFTVNSTDQGWYNSSGFHITGNTNYLVGYVDNNYRDFFAFDLSGVHGSVNGAFLRLNVIGFSSPDPSETVEFFDVTTPVATLSDGSGGSSTFDDLGTGTMYGSVSLSAADEGGWVNIPLNDAGVAAVASSLGGSFALGGYLSTYGGNSEYLFGGSNGVIAQLIVTTDTTPPVVTVPSDITAEATSPNGADVTYNVTATDETAPAHPSVTCDQPSGSEFPLGTAQPVTCSATDAAGNTGSSSFNVTVVDTTPPISTIDDPKPALYTNSASATIIFSGTDLVTAPGNLSFYCSLDNGSWNGCTSPQSFTGLGEGVHTISVYAVDEAGNSELQPTMNAVYSWTVDATAPVVTVPDNMIVDATSASGAIVNFDASATDETSPANPAVSCDWNSGATFPLGPTTVTCSATDDAGNIGSQSFQITVQDSDAPMLDLPTNISAPQTSPDGAMVNFNVSAYDAVDGSVTPTCDHNSGETFPLGTTTVNCSAADSDGNTSNGRFDVTVTNANNLLRKPDFGGVSVFPLPWRPMGFRKPFGTVLDCANFFSAPCSVVFSGTPKNINMMAMQKLGRNGHAGDTFSFGLSSAAQDIPDGGSYRVEVLFYNAFGKVIATVPLNFSTGTHDWESVSGTATAPANYRAIGFRFVFRQTSGRAWFDDAYLYFVP